MKQEMRKLLIGVVPLAFCDVAWYRNSCTTNLLTQPLKLVSGQAIRASVNVSRQLHGFLPDPQIAERRSGHAIPPAQPTASSVRLYVMSDQTGCIGIGQRRF